jgi:hypothetical protein
MTVCQVALDPLTDQPRIRCLPLPHEERERELRLLLGGVFQEVGHRGAARWDHAADTTGSSSSGTNGSPRQRSSSHPVASVTSSGCNYFVHRDFVHASQRGRRPDACVPRSPTTAVPMGDMTPAAGAFSMEVRNETTRFTHFTLAELADGATIEEIAPSFKKEQREYEQTERFGGQAWPRFRSTMRVGCAVSVVKRPAGVVSVWSRNSAASAREVGCLRRRDPSDNTRQIS